MSELNQDLVQKLAEHLARLPDLKTRSYRHQSWMTPLQIVDWATRRGYSELSAKTIDKELITLWRSTPELGVRPAKYPDRATLSRIWGHVDCVGVGPPDLATTVEGAQPGYEDLEFPKNTPIVFLSHSMVDVHFSSRVRLYLHCQGFGVWLSGAELLKECALFEDVQIALESSDILLVLLTANSLSSAWVDTEIETALGLDKPVYFVVDTCDDAVMHLMMTWQPGSPPTFDDDSLDEVEKEFCRQAHPERCEKFRQGATMFLQNLREERLYLYPKLPSGWKGEAKPGDFQELVTFWKKKSQVV